jgi:hypothetical protein
VRRAVVLVVLVVSVLRAQSTNASLTGRITDPSKALIADAKIAAISAATNLRYETATNAGGEYSLANLPPNSYRIEIEKAGFKKLIKPDVDLHVQDALEIDFEMTLGAASDTVTVEAGAPLVNTESGTVSTVVDRAFVENLPLNGRSFQTLIMLTPGAVVTVTAFDDQGQFSVNGQRADANYFTVDGVSANFGVTGYPALVQTASGALPALSASGGTNSLVSVDAMQEFRIQTSSFAPEFGRTPGGQISIVTRSGTNSFHGTLFEYFRNGVLDAKDWFVNFNGLAKPAERQNDFGGVLGGPIRKDKTFFFFSYEGLRLRQPSTKQTAVPDAASRQQAPAAMRPYLNAYPIANGPELGAGLAQFNAGYSNPSTLEATSIRLDHAVNSKISVFGRYNYSPSDLDQRSPPLSSGPVLSMTQAVSSSVQTGTAGLTETITPRIGNEVRANYSNHRVGSNYVVDNFGGAVPLPDSVLFPPGVSSKNAVFGLYIPGAGQYNQGDVGTSEQRQVNLVDNLSVTKAGHQLKFGVDYRRLAPFIAPFSYRQFVQFTGVTSAPGGALSGTASVAAAFAYQDNALLFHNFSLYGQDTWKITPRFTLTYGLRWDVNPPPKGKNAANDPFTVTGLNNPATTALAPRGTPLYPTTYGNVAPRLGLAWQLGGRPNWGVTLRAGFGIFYDLGSGSLGGVTSYFPYGATKIIPSALFPLSPQDAAPPAITLNPPVSTILVADPHLSLPRSYQWNLALEQSMGRSQSLSLTYIGAIGRDLLRVTILSNVNPNFPFVSVTDNSATSDYHALQLRFQRRLSRGLQAMASYTLSHSIDTSSTDAFSHYLNTPGAFASPNIDRGSSDFDIRHSFTTGLTYDLPSAGSPAARTIVGGWSLDGFVLARSAPPVDVVGGIYFAAGTGLYPRPNVNPGAPLELAGGGYPGGKIFNKAAFATPPVGQQGNFGRNVLRGFDATQADIGVQRQFRITEKVGLRFRAEFFNIFNHPNFGNPTTVLTSPLFGRSTQTLANSLGSGGANGGFNPLYQIGGPRSIQLALKLQF